MTPSLLRLGRRYLVRRPLQTILVVLGIALGVAVIIAIDLANGSASRAFMLSTEAISGKATHQIVGGPSGLPENIYARLRRELGLREMAPVVSDYVLVQEFGQRPMRLLGIDPFSEAPFRSYLGSGTNNREGDGESSGGTEGEPGLLQEQLTTFLTQPDSILLSEAVARQNELAVGNKLTLIIGAYQKKVTVVGLLKPADELSERALDSLLLADIATAQELLGLVGRLTTIDLILPTGLEGQLILNAIAEILPLEVRIERSSARSETIEQLTAAFELNLTALSLLALVVGMFLIYNTVTFSVVQRRSVLGTLRALGVTRTELFMLILSEALLMGILGALFGIGLGILLGRGVVQLITQTINDLYFVVNVQDVELAPETLLKGLFLGIGAALLAAIAPAYEATTVPPVMALRRSSLESKIATILPRLSITAVGLGILSLCLLLFFPDSIVFAFAALFLIMLTAALLTPLITMQLMHLFAIPLARLGVLGRMAPRDITRALSRTSVAIAALMAAVSVIVGVSVMIGSFRHTVTDWLNVTLQADIYISPPNIAANRSQAPLDPDVAAQIADIEGIESVAVARDVNATSPEWGSIRLVAVSHDTSGRKRAFKWVEGSQEEAWERAITEGAVFVSEPFAFRHDIERGERVRLFTDRGERSFPVVGVYYDYSSDQGVVLMAYPIYQDLYDDPYISSVAAYVATDRNVDDMVEQLRAFFVSKEILQIRSNVGLRTSVLEVFERAFAITGALQLLATIVAFIGVLSTLMALQLERARELGTLRAIGMTQGQLWSMTMLETALMGSTAGLWAMPIGFALSLVLIYVINLRTFGWTLQLQLEPMHFLEAFAVALIAALLAGIYPAIRMSQIRISKAIRSE